jgi:hypothetical protein
MWPIGKRVQVQWRASDDEWEDFVLLGVADGWVKLQGVPDRYGNPYDGGPLLAPLASIELFELVE